MTIANSSVANALGKIKRGYSNDPNSLQVVAEKQRTNGPSGESAGSSGEGKAESVQEQMDSDDKLKEQNSNGFKIGQEED